MFHIPLFRIGKPKRLHTVSCQHITGSKVKRNKNKKSDPLKVPKMAGVLLLYLHTPGLGSVSQRWWMDGTWSVIMFQVTSDQYHDSLA